MKIDLTVIFMYIILPFIFLSSAVIWVNWEKWRTYYPTVLFMVLLDFFASIMMFNHPLWRFEGTPIIPNNILVNFLIAFGEFPPAVLIYLSHYPKKWLNQVIWILFWVGIFSVIEYVSVQNGMMTYHNGWSFWFSVLFNCITFPVLRIHHSRPLLAWLIGLPVAFLIFWHFNFSISDMQ